MPQTLGRPDLQQVSKCCALTPAVFLSDMSTLSRSLSEQASTRRRPSLLTWVPPAPRLPAGSLAKVQTAAWPVQAAEGDGQEG